MSQQKVARPSGPMARGGHGTMQAVFDIAVYSRRERPTRRARLLRWRPRWMSPTAALGATCSVLADHDGTPRAGVDGRRGAAVASLTDPGMHHRASLAVGLALLAAPPARAWRDAAAAPGPASTVGGASAQARPVTVADLMGLRSISDVRISPDGRQVAYVVSRPALEKDEHEAVLYLVPAAGGTPQRLTFGTRIFNRPRPAPPLRWSPDATRLSFLA